MEGIDPFVSACRDNGLSMGEECQELLGRGWEVVSSLAWLTSSGGDTKWMQGETALHYLIYWVR